MPAHPFLARGRLRSAPQFLASVVALAGCVPTGNAGSQDAGAPAQPPRPVPLASPAVPGSAAPTAAQVAVAEPPMKLQFADDFEHSGTPPGTPFPASAGDGGSTAGWLEPSADWVTTMPGIWRIEAGHLCGERAHNHGIWLKRVLPVNARIEFDAVSSSPDGDLKAELWGDGRSYATALSYTNATSYLTIFGGWHNKLHVLARINEHGTDRKEINVDPSSDDPRQRPVVAGQSYHFKVERSDGKTIHWSVDGNEMLSFADTAPLMGPGHDHFGFNDWEVKVCFDNVHVVPLP
ncbi:MAG: hypothetical protein ACRENE_05290 [Polyangiaceae bacterium]